MHLDHVGVATPDADAAAERLGALLDASVVHEEATDELRFVFLGLEGAEFELLEPLGDDNPIAVFLADDRPGLHHVALGVPDVSAALRAAEAAGAELIDETPRPGARDHEIGFVHPRSAGGVLLEYVG